MGIFGDNDFGYDRTFDFDGDGKLNAFERSEALDFYTSSNSIDNNDDDNDDDMDYELELAGLDRWELEDMDEDERREVLEDAGLDPDDFDFY